MAAASMFAGAAIISGFGVGLFLLGRCAFAAKLHVAAITSGESRGRKAQKLLEHGVTHGVKPLQPLADYLARNAAVRKALQLFVEAAHWAGFLQASARSCGSFALAVVLGAIALLALALGSIASAAAVCLGIMAVVLARLNAAKEKRVSQDRQHVPETLQSMRACFQAGFSLQQTMAYLAEEAPGNLSGCYKRVVQSLRLGCSASEALAALRRESHAPELVFVSAALDVQHKTGGSLAPILLQAESSARAQFELERSLRVQTAQARLSSQVVTVMPFVLLAVFSLVSEGFLDPFFQSFAGVALFALALFMEALGVASVRKMLRVKGISS